MSQNVPMAFIAWTVFLILIGAGLGQLHSWGMI